MNNSDLILAILWMYRNSGSDIEVKEKKIELLIKAIKENKKLCRDFLMEEMDKIKLSLSRQIAEGISLESVIENILETVNIIMPLTSIYRNKKDWLYDVVIVSKLGKGIILYSTKKKIDNSANHGIFYDNSHNLAKISEKSVNVLSKEKDKGHWYNYGYGSSWLVENSQMIREQYVNLGSCDLFVQSIKDKIQEEQTMQIEGSAF